MSDQTVSCGRRSRAGSRLTLPTAPSPVTTHCSLLAGFPGANAALHMGVPLEIGLWGQPLCGGWERAVEGVLAEGGGGGGGGGDGSGSDEARVRGPSGLGQRE